MAKTKVSSPIFLLATAFLAVSASPLPSQGSTPPEGLILMGSTQDKELYITTPNITGDFTRGLAVSCPLQFRMSLAAVESPEEVAIIDNYFTTTQGNSSDLAWTSGVARIGLIPPHWASNGLRVSEFPAAVAAPWPSGAGSSPTYANYNCMAIHRACVRPPGTQIPGCFPAQTQFTYSPCDVQRRLICERRI